MVVLIFISAASTPYSVEALSKEQKKLYNKNIFYYDLACGALGPDATSTDTGSGTGKFLFVGDSIGVGMRDAGDLKKKITDKGFDEVTIDSEGSRSMISPGSGSTNGLQAIEKRSNEIKPDTAVIELGTNSSGTASSFKSDMKQSIDWIKASNENVKIYWVKVFSNVPHKSDYNNAMAEVAAAEKITLVDMGSLNLPLPDGLHPGSDGYKAAASFLAAEIVKETGGAVGVSSSPGVDCACPSGSALEGDNNAIKAYNFLIDKGLSPAQAAGIVGNMMRESGSDGYNLKPTVIGHGMCDPDCFGIVQWNTGRVAAMRTWAESQNKNPNELETQLGYVWHELNKYPEFGLEELKNVSGNDEAAAKRASRIFDEKFEISTTAQSDNDARDNNAARFLKEFVLGQGQAPNDRSPDESSGGCGASSQTDAKLKDTVKVDTPGKFIDMPGKYGCSGTSHKIDSRIAAGVAYFVDEYNMCITAGLEDGHKSHGAGLAIDVVPKNGDSKAAWKDSTEAAARAIGWYGDSADDPKSTKKSCANYGSGDYGTCMNQVFPDIFPKWMRWMGYNGAHCHGDPWHIYGGCGAHLHIGWASPNGGDAVSSSAIKDPIPSVYTFEAPIPDDLKGIIK